jgi:hypothetical protein
VVGDETSVGVVEMKNAAWKIIVAFSLFLITVIILDILYWVGYR